MASTKLDSPGHSYEPWAFMGADRSITTTMHAFNGTTWQATTVLKTLDSIQNYVYRTPSYGKQGLLARPDRIWLIRSADYGGPGSINNFPDPTDPHGDEGEPVLFADGHAEYIRTVNYVKSRDYSQDWNVGATP